jgi:hypothetical protein
VHDLVDLGVDLPEGDYATMAGLVLDRLGHVPRPPARPSTSMDGGSRSLRSPDAPSPEFGYNPAPTPLTHRHHPDELHRPNAGSKRISYLCQGAVRPGCGHDRDGPLGRGHAPIRSRSRRSGCPPSSGWAVGSTGR